MKTARRTTRISPAKRWGLIGAAALILCGFFWFLCVAEGEELYEEQWQASGAPEWIEQLPEETKALLSDLGIDEFELSSITTLQPKTAEKWLVSVAGEQGKTPFAVVGILLGTLLLCCLLNGTRLLAQEDALSVTYKTVGILAISTTLFLPLCRCITEVCEAMTGAFVLMGSFVPVYAGVLVSSGNPSVALSFQSVVLFTAEAMTAVLSGGITPLLTVSLGLGVAGSLDDTFPLSSISRFLNRLCTWTLGFFCTVFVGLLSLQTLVGTRADGVAIRAVRFSLANLVPVIGNAVSEAFGTVQNCLLVLRTTLGGIGILVTGILLIPPLVRCGIWTLLLNFCAAVSDTLAFSALSAVLRIAADVTKALLGILVCTGLFLILSVTVVTLTANGG